MDLLIETPIHRLRIDETGLCTWFGLAAIGDALIYHRGLLANDRAPAFSRLTAKEELAWRSYRKADPCRASRAFD